MTIQGPEGGVSLGERAAMKKMLDEPYYMTNRLSAA